MTENEPSRPPKESVGDHGHALTRAGLGAIPFVGQAAVELFNKVITPPIEKRRDEWRRTVGERLDDLEKRGALNLDDLADNESFGTTVLQASYAAIRNHQNEKLNALRNAVLNSALPSPPDESLQQVFLNLVDTFTVWHLRLLDLLENPVRWFQVHGEGPPSIHIGSLDSVIEAAFPELQGKRDFYDQVVKDLHDRGLIEIESVHTIMSGRGLMEERASSMGLQFLRFIRAPEVDG